MLNIGIIGYRSLVGSILHDRLKITSLPPTQKYHYFSTSQAQQKIQINRKSYTLKNAHNLAELQNMDIILTTQGSRYTQKIHPQLRKNHWPGYWIDAASYLRMAPNSIIVLDPINRPAIQHALKTGIKDFIGSNCTVSLMLMAIAGLTNRNLIKSIQATTYQSISGAGAQAIDELNAQVQRISQQIAQKHPSPKGCELINTLNQIILNTSTLPTDRLQAPLAYNLLPWIDHMASHGQSREEQKVMQETNKILQRQNTPIPIDATCVRTPTLRSHSQALILELHQNLPLTTIEHYISQAHPWIEIVPNTPQESLQKLSPASCANLSLIHI